MAQIKKINIKGVEYDIAGSGSSTTDTAYVDNKTLYIEEGTTTGGGGSNDLIIVGDNNYEQHVFYPVFRLMLALWSTRDKYDSAFSLHNFLIDDTSIETSFAKTFYDSTYSNDDIDGYGDEVGISNLWEKLTAGYYDNIIFRLEVNGEIVPNFELKLKYKKSISVNPHLNVPQLFNYEFEFTNFIGGRINKIIIQLGNSDGGSNTVDFHWAIISTKAEALSIEY